MVNQQNKDDVSKAKQKLLQHIEINDDQRSRT